MNILTAVILWVFSLFLALLGIAFFPHYACGFFVLGSLLLLPIKRFQSQVNSLIRWGKPKKVLLITVIIICGFISIPTQDSVTGDNIPENIIPPTKTYTSQNTDKHSDSGVDISNDATVEQLPTQEQSVDSILQDTLEVHFIDVGQGDCALITCSGHYMLIDGGNKSESDKVYSYLKKHDISHLDYIIGTHPDSDHIGGLSGALNIATIDYALCSTTSADNESFANFEKYVKSQGKTITVPSIGETFLLGNATVTVVGPVFQSTSDNNNSIVLRIDFGNTSFLFTGDAEEEEEFSILKSGANIRSTILKVAHHGSSSSCSDCFLDAVQPTYAVISVGKDNSYFHPTNATLDKIKQRDITLYRTDLQGTIICSSDGNSVSFHVEKDTGIDVFIPPVVPLIPNTTSEPNSNSSNNNVDKSTPFSAAYVLNTNTMKFHYPTCSSVGKIKDKNRSEYNGTRDVLLSLGYSPCGNCHP